MADPTTAAVCDHPDIEQTFSMDDPPGQRMAWLYCRECDTHFQPRVEVLKLVAEAAAPYRGALERLVREGRLPWEVYTPPVYIPPENLRLRAKYREALHEADALLRREVGE